MESRLNTKKLAALVTKLEENKPKHPAADVILASLKSKEPPASNGVIAGALIFFASKAEEGGLSLEALGNELNLVLDDKVKVVFLMKLAEHLKELEAQEYELIDTEELPAEHKTDVDEFVSPSGKAKIAVVACAGNLLDRISLRPPAPATLLVGLQAVGTAYAKECKKDSLAKKAAQYIPYFNYKVERTEQLNALEIFGRLLPNVKVEDFALETDTLILAFSVLIMHDLESECGRRRPSANLYAILLELVNQAEPLKRHPITHTSEISATLQAHLFEQLTIFFDTIAPIHWKRARPENSKFNVDEFIAKAKRDLVRLKLPEDAPTSVLYFAYSKTKDAIKIGIDVGKDLAVLSGIGHLYTITIANSTIIITAGMALGKYLGAKVAGSLGAYLGIGWGKNAAQWAEKFLFNKGLTNMLRLGTEYWYGTGSVEDVQKLKEYGYVDDPFISLARLNAYKAGAKGETENQEFFEAMLSLYLMFPDNIRQALKLHAKEAIAGLEARKSQATAPQTAGGLAREYKTDAQALESLVTHDRADDPATRIQFY